MKCRRMVGPRIGQATRCSLDHWPRKTTEPTAIHQLPGYNAATGRIASQLVFEVAVHNETMPRLIQNDLSNYFAPGTGTRAWVGIRIWVHANNNNHTWWAGWATRAKSPNGQLLDQPLLMPQSMSIVNSNNASIYQPVPQLVFAIDVDELIAPCQMPAGYPQHRRINLEAVRNTIVPEITWLWRGSNWWYCLCFMLLKSLLSRNLALLVCLFENFYDTLHSKLVSKFVGK